MTVSRNYHIRLSAELSERLRQYVDAQPFPPPYSYLMELALRQYLENSQEMIRIPKEMWDYAVVEASKFGSTPQLYLLSVLKAAMRNPQDPSQGSAED